MATYNGIWEECEGCQKQHNKLACLLHDCEIREQKTKETIRRWHKEWTEKKLCFACAHCKHRDAWEHGNQTTVPYWSLERRHVKSGWKENATREDLVL